MLARLPEIPPGQTCDPKTGWLPDHFQDQCREIANKYVQQTAKKLFCEERERIRLTKTMDECDAVDDKDDAADESRIIIEGKKKNEKYPIEEKNQVYIGKKVLTYIQLSDFFLSLLFINKFLV